MDETLQFHNQNGSFECTDEDDYAEESPAIYTPQALVANMGGTGLTITGMSTSAVQVPCEQNNHIAVVAARVQTDMAEVQMIASASPAEIQGDKDVDRLLDRAIKKAFSKAADMTMLVRSSNVIQEQYKKESLKEDFKAIDCPALSQKTPLKKEYRHSTTKPASEAQMNLLHAKCSRLGIDYREACSRANISPDKRLSRADANAVIQSLGR